MIQFQVPEFTCHCPLTGQPDFAHFTIDMIADELCVELKSLKMYFWSYRNEGAFHEKVTNTILDDIVKATAPRFARLTANKAYFLITNFDEYNRQPQLQKRLTENYPLLAQANGFLLFDLYHPKK